MGSSVPQRHDTFSTPEVDLDITQNNLHIGLIELGEFVVLAEVAPTPGAETAGLQGAAAPILPPANGVPSLPSMPDGLGTPQNN